MQLSPAAVINTATCTGLPSKLCVVVHRTQLQQGVGHHGGLLAMGCDDWRFQPLHSTVAGTACMNHVVP